MIKYKMPFKCGEFVKLNTMSQPYTFLGYIDKDCKRGLIANLYGDKLEIWINDITHYQN